MDEVKIIEIKKSVFADNVKDADALRAELKEKKVFLLNVMSSPGSGKTTTLTRQGLGNLDLEETDLVILENVGNLVCPAEFDTGATCNAMILSVPEGDDKPLKYPLMFSICDVVIINKMDVVPYFDFDLERCKKYIHLRNPQAQIIPISAKTGFGLDHLAEWLLKQLP